MHRECWQHPITSRPFTQCKYECCDGVSVWPDGTMLQTKTSESEWASPRSWRRCKNDDSAWYGHVLRSNEKSVARIALRLNPHGQQPRRRTKKRWLDHLKDDMRHANIPRRKLWTKPNRDGRAEQRTLLPCRKIVKTKKMILSVNSLAT